MPEKHCSHFALRPLSKSVQHTVQKYLCWAVTPTNLAPESDGKADCLHGVRVAPYEKTTKEDAIQIVPACHNVH
jgi:hypothetical protein